MEWLKQIFSALLQFLKETSSVKKEEPKKEFKEEVIPIPIEPEIKYPPLPQIILKRLKGCYPPFREKIITFIQKAHAEGMVVYVVMSIRTIAEQDALYEIGRRGIAGEKTVTKAKGGQSYHNYGLSIDVAFDRDLDKEGVQWSWDDAHPWAALGKLGESCGLEWGGNWKGMTGDLGHFQLSYGLTWQKLKAIYNNGGMKNVWKELDKTPKD